MEEGDGESRMNHAIDLFKAFEIHYSDENQRKYSVSQLQELTDKYAWISQEYSAALYDEVVSTHPAALRSLPDMAVLHKAEKALDRPEVYEKPKPMIEDKTGPTFDEVENMLARKRERDGEPNHFERERIRHRVAKGDATRAEGWWIHIIDHEKGVWKPMPDEFMKDAI